MAVQQQLVKQVLSSPEIKQLIGKVKTMEDQIANLSAHLAPASAPPSPVVSAHRAADDDDSGAAAPPQEGVPPTDGDYGGDYNGDGWEAVLSKLEDRILEDVHALGDEVHALEEQSIKDQLGWTSHFERLQEQLDANAQSISELRGAAGQNRADDTLQLHKLSERVAGIESLRLDESGRSAAAKATAQQQQMRLLEEEVEALQQSTSSLQEQATRSQAQLQTELAASQKRLQAALEQEGQKLQSAAAAKVAEVAGAQQQHAGQIVEEMETLRLRLDESGRSAAAKATAQQQQMRLLEEEVEALQQSTSSLQEQATRSQAQLQTELAASQKRLQAALEQEGQKLQSAAAAKVAEVARAQQQHAGQIVEEMETLRLRLDESGGSTAQAANEQRLQTGQLKRELEAVRQSTSSFLREQATAWRGYQADEASRYADQAAQMAQAQAAVGAIEKKVSHSCAWIGSPCLRHCVHGASIGGRSRGDSHRGAAHG
jgi:hypothetical protein